MKNISTFKVRHAGRLEAAASMISDAVDVTDSPVTSAQLQEALTLLRAATDAFYREAVQIEKGE